MTLSMKNLLKALLSTIVLVGILIGALAVVLVAAKSWPSEMKSLFDLYVFPILIFLVCGFGGVTFIKILMEERKK